MEDNATIVEKLHKKLNFANKSQNRLSFINSTLIGVLCEVMRNNRH